MTLIYLIVTVGISAAAFMYARDRAQSLRANTGNMHSLPGYHGWFAAIMTGFPMIGLMALWSSLAPRLIEAHALSGLSNASQLADPLARATALREISNATSSSALADAATPEIRAAAETLVQWSALSDWALLILGVALGLAALFWAMKSIAPQFRARNKVETAVRWILIACSGIALLTTFGIVFSVLFESMRFFAKYPVIDFLFGTQWSPQIAMRTDQVGQSGAFGFIPVFTGTILIMLVAMTVAVPIGLLAAIYLSEYASPRFRAIAKPVLEILAGVPTVVFGFFAALTVAPLIRDLGASVGLDVASESALAAGLVMGMMIIPFISSLSDDVINSVPQSLRDGSYAMGATKSETIRRVILPTALPGIVSAVMLAVSRAVGETMIVVMAAGLAGNLTFNPLDAVTTITVQIKTLLVGDQEFDSLKTLSAFALGLVLFFFTLVLNVIALQIVKRYREQYD